MDEMKLLLPFSVPSEDRKLALNEAMELASIFCLAEMNREKGGGLISKKPPEEILFITEICYPFWLLPWSRNTLVLEGLDTQSHVVSIDILPDAKMFINQVKGSAHKPEAYSTFLSYNLDYFEEFTGKSHKVIKGLIVNPSFTEDLFSLLHRARRIKGHLMNKVLLTPVKDKSMAEASLSDLLDLKNALKDDVKSLRSIVNTLVKTTQKHIASISKEIERTHKQCEARIDRLKLESMQEIEKMREAYDQEIIRISEETDHLIQDLSQRRAKLEVDRQRLETFATQCEKEAAAAQDRKNEIEESHWKQNLEESRNDLTEINVKIIEADKEIEDAKIDRDLKISRLKSDYVSKAGEIEAGLKKIEAARDVKVEIDKQKIEALEKTTSAIIDRINRLIELRNLKINQIDRLGYPAPRKKYAIVYLPFFLVCYRRDLEKRYIMFPPSVANTLTGIKKIKGTLRSFNVRMILHEISMSISNFLNDFVNMTEQNTLFEDSIIGPCLKADILKTRVLRKNLRIGLKGLLAEGWLSEEELKFLNDRLSEMR